MNTTNTKKTTLNDQAAQAQVTQPTLFRQDIKETLRSWLEPYGVFDGKFYSEISHMLCMAVTSDYLNELNMQNLPEPEVAGAELLQRTADAFRTFNEVFAEVAGAAIEGLNIPDELAPCQIARLIQLFFHAVQYSRSEIYGDDYMRKWCNGDDEDIAVMVYFDEHIYYNPFETGIYVPDWPETVSIIDPRYMINIVAPYKEIEFWLKVFAKRVKEADILDDTFIPIRNGILDCRTKKLMPFSPEHVVIGVFNYDLEYVESENGPVLQDCRDRTVSYPVDEWIEAELKKRR